MDGLSIGPLFLPWPRLFGVLALLAVPAMASVLGRGRGWRLRNWGWPAALAMVVGGRVVHVLQNLDSFAGEPWTALYLWQGGMNPLGALAAGVGWAFVAFGTRPGLLLRGLACLAAAAAIWLGGRAFVGPVPAMPLPPVTVYRLSGEPVEIAGLEGQPLVLNLWATWCPPCRRELPLLIETARSHPGVRFALASQGEPAEAVIDYLERRQLPSQSVLLDPGSRLGDALRAPALPTTLWFDARGVLRDRHAGEVSRARLAEGLRRIGVAAGDG